MPYVDLNGWFAVRQALSGTLDAWSTDYYWDSRKGRLSRADAIAEGLEAYGSDDFCVAHIVEDHLVWWGWMDQEHPDEDRMEAAVGLGLASAAARSQS
jgi:hypothetical protein